jgi:hypothetical protein
MKTKILLPAIAIVITGVAAFGSIGVFAQTTQTDPHTSIIQRLVSKFGLKEDEVKAVFDAERTERQKEMQTRMTERLTQAVTDGKITEQQKQLIIAKQAELQKERETNRGTMQNLTNEQRKAKMEEHRTEIEAWAKENNIDTQYLFGGMKGGRGMHMMR